jgi:hypothetical protein
LQHLQVEVFTIPEKVMVTGGYKMLEATCPVTKHDGWSMEVHERWSVDFTRLAVVVKVNITILDSSVVERAH